MNHIINHGIESFRIGISQHDPQSDRNIILTDHSGPHGIIHIMVNIGQFITETNHLALKRGRFTCCLMIENTVTDFSGQIQTAAVFFKLFYHTNALLIMPESIGTASVQSSLSGMTKRCVPQIMSQSNSLRQVFIQSKRLGNSAGDL